ncbi:MAG: hypothetical protein U1A77_02245 [Pirellulales bacterium]
MSELYDVELTGCTSTPWMAYLKTRGVLGIVVEQADANARLTWRRGVARLHSRLNRASLVDFFVRQYSPTPMLAPWSTESGLHDGCDSPGGESVIDLLNRLRLNPQEVGMQWLDASFEKSNALKKFLQSLMHERSEQQLDFTRVFCQRLVEVMTVKGEQYPPADAERSIAMSLFSDAYSPTRKTPIRKFTKDHGGEDGQCQVCGRLGVSDNPWDYMLAVEGMVRIGNVALRRTREAPLRKDTVCSRGNGRNSGEFRYGETRGMTR